MKHSVAQGEGATSSRNRSSASRTCGQSTELLDGYCREAGREPAAVERSIQFGPDAIQNGAGELVALGQEFVSAGATHLIVTCPIPYSAAGARRLWNEVVTPLRR